MSMMIETNRLTKRFGSRTSVDQLDLRVPQGQIYGFLGANGAGKTTTIRMLLSLMRPDEGDIEMMGRPLVREREAILRRVGCLVESPSYYGHLSAYDNLKIITRLLGLPDRNIRRALDTVRLTSHARQKVSGYSLGMKQRLGIAQALVRDPELFILDEPINGLDPAGIQEIRQLLLALCKEQGKTIFLSSHILSEIQAVSDWVGIIKDGRLLFQERMEVLEERSRPTLSVFVIQAAEAYETLVHHGVPVERQGDKLLIDMGRGMSQEQVFQLLRPYSIQHVQESAKTLEDIFLELTGSGDSL